MFNYQSTIESLPDSAGVYRYYDKKDNLLYIGKAKSLKKRVSSYFRSSKAHNQRTTLMVSLVDRIEYTQVQNEKEALILEANLINNLQPKYNVLLKDDKSYIYIEYTKKDPIPGFFLVRRKENLNSIYFGPYTNTRDITNIMKILRTIFPFCQDRIINNKKCQYCSIKQCLGICDNLENIEYYTKRNNDLIAVLNGKSKLATNSITKKLNQAIQKENYKLAGFYRDNIIQLNNLSQRQKIVLSVTEDLDLISLVYQINEDGQIISSFFVQQIRDGKIINVFNSILAGINNSFEDDMDYEKNQKTEDNTILSILDNYLYNYTTKNGYNIPVLWNISQFV